MAKTLTKKEIQAPDHFQNWGSHALKWVEDHIREIIILGFLVVLASFAWIGYGYYNSYQETQAEKELFSLKENFFPTLQKSSEIETLKWSEFNQTLKDNAGRKATAQTAIQAVQLLKEKENTESLQKEIMDSAGFAPKENHVLFGLWHLTLGQVLSRNGESLSAKEEWQKVLHSSKQTEFHPYALIQLGTLARKEGDLSGAKDLYQRVISEFPETEASKLANKLLIHLDLMAETPQKGS